MSDNGKKLKTDASPASKGWVACMIEAALVAAVKPLAERVKAMEQVQLLDFVGIAQPGTAYTKGTLALDGDGRLWIAIKDDDGASTGDLGEPTWRKLSDKRLASTKVNA